MGTWTSRSGSSDGSPQAAARTASGTHVGSPSRENRQQAPFVPPDQAAAVQPTKAHPSAPASPVRHGGITSREAARPQVNGSAIPFGTTPADRLPGDLLPHLGTRPIPRVDVSHGGPLTEHAPA